MPILGRSRPASAYLVLPRAAPPTGVYTLFSQTGTGGVLQSDHSAQTMGVQFSVSVATSLTAIWFYSKTGAGDLPANIGLYQVTGTGTGTLLHSETASWSGAAASGWVRAAFSSPPALSTSTNYKAVIFHVAGSFNFYTETDNYWSSGPGASGITNGPLSAPNNAGADIGQDSYHLGSTITYPATTFSSANYWIDPEVTVGSGTTFVTVSDSAGQVESFVVTATVPVADVAAQVEDGGIVTATVPVSDAAGQVEAVSITATVPTTDAAGQVESLSISATLSVSDVAAGLDAVATAVAISVSDAAGSVESAPGITANVPVSEYAAVVESIFSSVLINVADFAAGLDTLAPSSLVPNRNLPAIVLVAATYVPH